MADTVPWLLAYIDGDRAGRRDVSETGRRGVSRAVGGVRRQREGGSGRPLHPLPGRQPGVRALKTDKAEAPEVGFGEDDGFASGHGMCHLAGQHLGAGCPNAGSSWRGPGDAERLSLHITKKKP